MVKPLRLSSAIPKLDENVTCVGYPMGAVPPTCASARAVP